MRQSGRLYGNESGTAEVLAFVSFNEEAEAFLYFDFRRKFEMEHCSLDPVPMMY